MIAYHQQAHMDANYHSILEACLREIISFIKPSADDTLKRQNAIKEIEVAIWSDRSLIEAGAAVKPFGSYISNLYTKWGDLDISIDLAQSKPSPDDRKHKINVLHKIMRALQRTGVANNVEFVRSARVPLLVYTSKSCKVSCDISIDNHAGYVKSCILRLISNIDTRFCEFVLLIKEWAKAQHINDPKTGTLNSYSLCLLVIFHFQTCTPAILPPLKDLYEGNIVSTEGDSTLRHMEASVAANIGSYMSKISRHRNQSSLSQLLTSFFDKFSKLDALALDFVICTYTGKWEPINNSKIRWMRKFQLLLIEDPFEQNENAARAVGASGLAEISRVCKAMSRNFSSRSILSDRSSLLSNLLGPEIRSKLDAGRQPIHQQPPGYFANSASSQSQSTSGFYGLWE